MGDKTLEQLEEQIDSIKARLQLQISELVEIVTNDLPDYALKHIRRAFIEDVDFAETQSDEDLARFKAKVVEFGVRLAEEVRASLLADMNDWWGPQVSLEGAGKTLDGNEKIRRKLEVIPERILHFIESEHYKTVEVVYNTPARFINGKYPPGMIEKYWSQLAILRSAEEERAVLDQEDRKARLARRWESI